AARTGEVRIERGVVVVDGVAISSRGVGLPQLDQRMRDGPAVLVEHASGHNDALADGLALVLTRQVAVSRLDVAISEHWTGDLGERVRQEHQRPPRAALDRRAVAR